MSKRLNPLYQGRDWFSYRWTVAQAFDAVERLYDICLCATDEEKTPRSEDRQSLSSMLFDLSELLSAQLAVVYGDAIPATLSVAPIQQHWDCFETSLCLRTLRQGVIDFAQARTDSLERIVTDCLQLKEYIKKIDT